MLLSNLETVPGHKIIQYLNLVSGSTVRGKDIITDTFASIKNIFGGEINSYTHLLEETRTEAIQRLILKAEKLGANAIVGIRFSSSNIADEASELFVYGTAVIVEPVKE
ncbi:hypothetical protein A6M14_09235 [Acinetobacter sp. Ac_877]|uniref:YbjQ family protein n=1 Tax=Acinetobacter portensis TaxID=1839785 RepID=UPI00128B51B3|nr:YbjQ family protein [Acinetobacter portensis]MPW41652.1 hypothetical protein [Acinetobacter portensis]